MSSCFFVQTLSYLILCECSKWSRLLAKCRKKQTKWNCHWVCGLLISWWETYSKTPQFVSKDCFKVLYNSWMMSFFVVPAWNSEKSSLVNPSADVCIRIFPMKFNESHKSINKSRLILSSKSGPSLFEANRHWQIRCVKVSRLLLCKYNQYLILCCCVYSYIFIFPILRICGANIWLTQIE